MDLAPFSSCTYQLLRQLEELAGVTPSSVLVDVGCGIGGVALWFAREHGCQVVGIDRCGDAIEIASHRAREWGLSTRARFQTGDFCASGLASASADAMVSVDAFTATDGIEAALAEVRRVLKPGGRFVFTARELREKGRHFKSIGKDWGKALPRYGFEEVHVTVRPNVSELWGSIYKQWLQHESALRKELQAETVDALIKEARSGIPSMSENRNWLLIAAKHGARPPEI